MDLFKNYLKKVRVALTVLITFSSMTIYAQGSRSLYPNNTQGNRAFLVCTNNVSNNGESWPYPTMGTHYVYAESGEVIATAFSGRSSGNSGGAIRITSPTGTQYLTDTGTVFTSASGGNANGGLIANRQQELAGPNNGDAASQNNRYTPFTVNVNQTGVWKVEFLPIRDNTSVTNYNMSTYTANGNWTQSAGSAYIAAWDIAVRKGTIWKPGRVYANVLNLILPSEWEESEAFYSKMYVLTKDGIAYKVTYDGNQGAGWTFFVNNKGFIKNGMASYKSLDFSAREEIEPYIHNPTGPDDVGNNRITHKMFYDVPGADLPNTLTTQTPIAGGTTTWLKNPRKLPDMTNLTFMGIEGTEGQAGSKGAYISFDSNVKGLYKVIIPSTPPKILTGPCELGPNQIYWDGTDGNGNLVPAGTSIGEVTTQLYGAEVHFPFIDMEINPRGIIIEQLTDTYDLFSPTRDVVYWDDNDVTGGNVNRRSNPKINSNAGTGISSITNGHKWGVYTENVQDPSGGYNGTPNNDGKGNGDFGNTRSIDTWSYAPGESQTEPLQIVIRATDLRVNTITKVSGPAAASLGSNLTYDVPVFNNGPSNATTAATNPATFFFYAPPGTTINPASVSFINAANGAALIGTKTFDAATGIFKVTIDMPNQSGGTFRIPLTVIGNVPADKVNVWGAMLRPNDMSDPDATNPDTSILIPADPFQEAKGIYQLSSALPLFTNPTAINIASTNNIKLNNAVSMYADMSVIKTVTPGTGHAIGQNITFKITAVNNGVSTANNVKVIDMLSSRYIYVSSTATAGAYNPTTGLWNLGEVNSGASNVLSIVATINDDGGAQSNTATIMADEFDPNMANNSSIVTTSASVQADISIVKTGYRNQVYDSDNFVYNGTATFTLVVKNNGPSDATNIIVKDILTSQYANPGSAYTISTGSYSYASGSKTITWTIPALASGATATMVFNTNYSRSALAGQQVNKATVTANEGDPVSSNNTSQVTPNDVGSTTTVNVGIEKTVSTGTPNVGANVIFTIKVSKASASNSGVTVSVTDLLPPGYQFVSSTVTTGSYSSTTGVWSNIVLGATNTLNATLTITAKVKAPTGTTDEYKNIATISASNRVDDNLNNNIDSATVTPLKADLQLTKKASAMTVKIGSNVEFTITVKNNGPNTATSVTATDLLPAGYTYVSHIASTGTSYSSTNGVWTFSTNMASGATAILLITAKVKATGDLLNVASVTSAVYDPVLYNNSDSVLVKRKNTYVVTNPMVRSRVK